MTGGLKLSISPLYEPPPPPSANCTSGIIVGSDEKTYRFIHNVGSVVAGVSLGHALV